MDGDSTAPSSPGEGHLALNVTKQIVGQIGEPKQKEKLRYAGLKRQIQKALQKGYDDKVVEAVIQPIVPGIKLKSYLESRVGLTLQALRQILRTLSIEKDAIELYHSPSLRQPRNQEKRLFIF